MSAEELEVWQTDLNPVGCWVGPVDGQLGPQTQAAVEAFQAAKGLEADGILGPQTEGALQEAVNAGEIVSTSGSAEGGDESRASLSAPSYSKDFAIGTCSNSGESDIELAAESDNITLTVSADMADFTKAAGAGMPSVEGGTESDGITLDGKSLQTFDALMTPVQEFNDSVEPVIGGLAAVRNAPMFVLPWLDMNGPKPLDEVSATLASLHTDPAATLFRLEDAGLIERQLEAEGAL